MLYPEIGLVSVLGMHGTLLVQEDADADGVTVQIKGPYEAKVTDDCWLFIYPEGHEPPVSAQTRANVPITSGRTHLGSVDGTARAQFLTDSVPRVRTRASMRVKATVRITAPPGTRFELIGCHGLRKGPRGWRSMQGNSRFDIR